LQVTGGELIVRLDCFVIHTQAIPGKNMSLSLDRFYLLFMRFTRHCR
jgi:hypothetical protein